MENPYSIRPFRPQHILAYTDDGPVCNHYTMEYFRIGRPQTCKYMSAGGLVCPVPPAPMPSEEVLGLP
jgi:hypothetical protein